MWFVGKNATSESKKTKKEAGPPVLQKILKKTPGK